MSKPVAKKDVNVISQTSNASMASMGSQTSLYPQTQDPSISSMVNLKGSQTTISPRNPQTPSGSNNGGNDTDDENDEEKAVKSNDLSLKNDTDLTWTGSADMTATPRRDDDSSEVTVYRRRSVLRLDLSAIPKNTEMDAPARFVGESTYRQSVVFLLGLASFRCFPDRQLTVQSIFSFRLTARSYYCRFVNHTCTKEDVIKLQNEMKNLVKMEIPVKEKWMMYDDCIQHFTDTNQLFSAKLAKTLNRSRYLVVGCTIDKKQYYCLSYRHLYANTKHIHEFGLFQADHNDEQNDFILVFPSKNKKTGKINKITQPKEALSIRRLFLQGVELGKVLGVECVGDLNEIIQRGKMTELILLSEAYHDMQIVNMAKSIKNKHNESNNKLKIILISGPSSSGKTTFASKLCIQLKLMGLNPVSMEVDMFYKDRKDPTHPRDNKGELNFEVIEAVRIDYLQSCLTKLMNGETITVPNFSFVDGHIHPGGEELQLPKKNGILVMEGIFCLNPKLTNTLDNDSKFKVFMCPVSFFNLDNHHFLSEQIVRLIRRVSRDHRRRNKTANSVLFKWGQLQGGEDDNIFPYVDECDQVFNSILPYEIPVLKVFSKPLIQTIMPKEKQYKDAQNLLAFLDSFVTMPDSGIPSTSLIQEFMGESVYDSL